MTLLALLIYLVLGAREPCANRSATCAAFRASAWPADAALARRSSVRRA